MFNSKRIAKSTKSRIIAIAVTAIGLLLTLAGAWFAYAYESLFLIMAVLVSSTIVVIMTILKLKINSNILVLLAGVCLTFLSFAYQPLGPEIRQWGTECIPLEECFAPVRGGGFPIQYVIDFPGVTSPDDLGFEDEFRIWAFVLDLVFYSGLVYLTYRTNRYFLARKRNSSKKWQQYGGKSE